MVTRQALEVECKSSIPKLPSKQGTISTRLPSLRSRAQRFSSLMSVVLSYDGEVAFALFKADYAERRNSLMLSCIDQCRLVRLQSRLHFKRSPGVFTALMQIVEQLLAVAN